MKEYNPSNLSLPPGSYLKFSHYNNDQCNDFNYWKRLDPNKNNIE